MKKSVQKNISVLLFISVALGSLCGGCATQIAGEIPEPVSDQPFSTNESVTVPVESNQLPADVVSSEILNLSIAETREAEYYQIEDERPMDISGGMLVSFQGEDIIRHKLRKSFDKGNSFGMVSVRDGIFLGTEYGLDFSRVTFVLDVTQGQDKTVILDKDVPHPNPRFLDNGLIVLGADPYRKKLVYPDGTPAPITLSFDYGIDMNSIDDNTKGWEGSRGMEYRMECVTYDAKSARYIAAFSRSTFFKSEDQREMGPVGIAVFNANGKQTDWFMLDGVETRQIGIHSGIGPSSDLFMLANGNVLFSDPEGDEPVVEGKHREKGVNAEINLKTHKYETYENGEIEERYGETDNLHLSSVMHERVCKKQPPCPLIVEYAPDGTHVYKRDENKTLIQTLDKGYELVFYAVDIDGTCYLMFRKE